MLELTLTLAPVEGALLPSRSDGTARIPARAIQSRPTPAGLDVRLTLAADDRPGDVLRQVQRLHDVRQARMDFIQPQPVRTAPRRGSRFTRVMPPARAIPRR